MAPVWSLFLLTAKHAVAWTQATVVRCFEGGKAKSLVRMSKINMSSDTTSLMSRLPRIKMIDVHQEKNCSKLWLCTLCLTGFLPPSALGAVLNGASIERFKRCFTGAFLGMAVLLKKASFWRPHDRPSFIWNHLAFWNGTIQALIGLESEYLNININVTKQNSHAIAQREIRIPKVQSLLEWPWNLRADCQPCLAWKVFSVIGKEPVSYSGSFQARLAPIGSTKIGWRFQGIVEPKTNLSLPARSKRDAGP